LPVPFTQMKATIALLTALQQSVAQANNGMTVSFQVAGSQVSAAARQAQGCNVVELIADATSQAQKVASAANLVVGPILALSSGTSTPGPASVGFVSFALVGSVGSGIGTTPQQTCAVTVKFSLLKF